MSIYVYLQLNFAPTGALTGAPFFAEAITFDHPRAPIRYRMVSPFPDTPIADLRNIMLSSQ